MTYYDKYHCIGCPVEKYCGKMVSCTKLCHSYKEAEEGVEEEYCPDNTFVDLSDGDLYHGTL